VDLSTVEAPEPPRLPLNLPGGCDDFDPTCNPDPIFEINTNDMVAPVDELPTVPELARRLQELITRGDDPGLSVTQGLGTEAVLEELAQGRSAPVVAANRPHEATAVDPDLLRLLLALHQAGQAVELRLLTNGEHPDDSAHYYGRAMDVGKDLDLYRYLFEHRQELCISSLITMPPEDWPQGTYNLYRGERGNTEAGGHTESVHISVMEDCDIEAALLPPLASEQAPPAGEPATPAGTETPAAITPPDILALDAKALAQLALDQADHPERPEFNGNGRLTLRTDMKARQTLEQVAGGQKATVDASNRPHDQTDLDPKILRILFHILRAGYEVELWELTTGEHIDKSYHYYGRALTVRQDFEIYAFIFRNHASWCVSSLITMPPEVWPEGTHNLFVGKYGNASIAGHTDLVYVSINPNCQ